MAIHCNRREGVRRYTSHHIGPSVCMHASPHLHAIHDERLIVSRNFSVPRFVPFRVSLLHLALLFPHPHVLCPEPLLPCGQRRGKHTLRLRQLRSLALWQNSLLPQLVSTRKRIATPPRQKGASVESLQKSNELQTQEEGGLRERLTSSTRYSTTAKQMKGVCSDGHTRCSLRSRQPSINLKPERESGWSRRTPAPNGAEHGRSCGDQEPSLHRRTSLRHAASSVVTARRRSV